MGEGPDSSYRAVRNFPWHGGVPAGPAARLKLRRITRTCHILSWAARTVLAAICAQRPERAAGVCLGQAGRRKRRRRRPRRAAQPSVSPQRAAEGRTEEALSHA